MLKVKYCCLIAVPRQVHGEGHSAAAERMIAVHMFNPINGDARKPARRTSTTLELLVSS
jgi:hypothetical protein